MTVSVCVTHPETQRQLTLVRLSVKPARGRPAATGDSVASWVATRARPTLQNRLTNQ